MFDQIDPHGGDRCGEPPQPSCRPGLAKLPGAKRGGGSPRPPRTARSQPVPGSQALARPLRELSQFGLFLLGTVHGDPKGFSRTRVFLEQHRPDLILVEISAFALKFRKERSPELRRIFLERLRTASQKLKIEYGAALKHFQIAGILRQISIPFEYRASAAYAKRTGGDLIAVDYSGFSREWIERTWPEMISVENIERLLELESAGPSVCSQYARAARRISGEPPQPGGAALPPGPAKSPRWEKSGEFFRLETPTETDSISWQEREKHIAREIESALELLSPERPLYIGGWWHLSCGGMVKTIRELLGIGEDSCMLLDRAHKCHFR